eukprot:GHUV01022479.1.p2 GENE.GHUV01022479.1~~GHUV01022479.1.p2  ORF type:complete len:133 (+),score=9.07 GHUV01022479.1:1578-1976(+)
MYSKRVTQSVTWDIACTNLRNPQCYAKHQRSSPWLLETDLRWELMSHNRCHLVYKLYCNSIIVNGSMLRCAARNLISCLQLRRRIRRRFSSAIDTPDPITAKSLRQQQLANLGRLMHCTNCWTTQPSNSQVP